VQEAGLGGLICAGVTVLTVPDGICPDRFAGKVAIVTGGASGIGAATSRRLIAEGASVVVADINGDAAAALADELGAGASSRQCDLGNIESMQALVDDTVARHGALHVLHNNAAITDPAIQGRDVAVADLDFEIWGLTLDVNLRGYAAASKFAIPHMLAQGGGTIVNTASGAGLAGDLVRTAYGVSKAGVIVLTKYIATQYGRQGIRCNAICPGLVLTPGLRATASELIDVLERYILIRNHGEPEDIAALACFLAADESRFIQGQSISIDGGMYAHHPQTLDVVELMARLQG